VGKVWKKCGTSCIPLFIPSASSGYLSLQLGPSGSKPLRMANCDFAHSRVGHHPSVALNPSSLFAVSDVPMCSYAIPRFADGVSDFLSSHPEDRTIYRTLIINHMQAFSHDQARNEKRSLAILPCEPGRASEKNKCGPGQPPKPHCCRGRSDCRLSHLAKDRRTALLRVLCIDANLRLAPQS